MYLLYSNETKTTNEIVNPTEQNLLEVINGLDNMWREHVQLSTDKSFMTITGSIEGRVCLSYVEMIDNNRIVTKLIDEKFMQSDKVLDIGYRGGSDPVYKFDTVPIDVAREVAMYFLNNIAITTVVGFVWK
jgi:hypothetical protein